MSDRTAIRPATASDAPALAELSGVLGYPATPEAFALRLAPLLVSTDNIILVAQLDGGEIVGWIHGGERNLLETGPRCEILGLVVAAESRGRGIGRALVSAIEEWARKRGFAELAVRSNITRQDSHPFYYRLGYARVKTQHAYRKSLLTPGEPA
ncbi:MAG: GNAT family N-acetyltransferase [Gemmatimonadales bacterium]|nr:MAG: GNAT family N-acetyltransferase [Gemmatimonadales bacterium]